MTSAKLRGLPKCLEKESEDQSLLTPMKFDFVSIQHTHAHTHTHKHTHTHAHAHAHSHTLTRTGSLFLCHLKCFSQKRTRVLPQCFPSIEPPPSKSESLKNSKKTTFGKFSLRWELVQRFLSLQFLQKSQKD